MKNAGLIAADPVTFVKLGTLGLPALLTIVATFSITQGILWGFISHVGLYLIVGRRRDIHPVMYALAGIAIGLLLPEHAKLW